MLGGARTVWLGFALALAGAGVAGCPGPRAATQVIVSVLAEPGVRAETDTLSVRVRGAAVGADLVEVSAVTYSVRDLDGIPDPVVLAIAPFGGDPSRLFEAEAEAFDRVGGTVGIARLRGAFQPGRTVELRLVLEDRCRGVRCPDGETCRQGRCVPATVDPGMDAGVTEDGGSDGGVPVGGDCRTDAQCDDGVYCNGTETCAGSRCAAGVRPTCDDGIACTVDQCVSTGCVNRADATLCTAGPDGTCDPATGGCQYSVCDSTNCASTGCEAAECSGTICRRNPLCGAGQTCCAGACVRAGCDDGNACTTDLCDPMLGCTNHASFDARTCSDGNPCTDGDECRRDVCVPGGAVVCDDGNPCTAERCDAVAGCIADPVATGTPCADADACDGLETCVSGVCAAGTPLDCDDRIACTVDSCAAAGGCVHAPSDALCTALPGGSCDAGSGCQYPSCVVGTTCIAGPCQTATCRGTTCVLSSTCTSSQTCCAGACVNAGCADSNPCTADACVAGVGCMNVAQSGVPCEDGDACTVGDSCTAGACTAGPGCSDGNPCTDDVCTAGTCSFPANTATCEDGSGCTVSDRCAGGVCQAGNPLFCDDSNDCTADSCAAGTCLHEPLTGIDCGLWEMCVRHSCEAGICRSRPIPGCCLEC